jgi:hypothetical protein
MPVAEFLVLAYKGIVDGKLKLSKKDLERLDKMVADGNETNEGGFTWLMSLTEPLT